MVNAPLTCRLDDKLIVEGNACVMVNVEIQFSTGYLFSLSSSFFFFPPPLYPLDLARIERTSNLCPRNCIFLPSPLSFYTGNNTDNRSIVFEAIILLTEIYSSSSSSSSSSYATRIGYSCAQPILWTYSLYIASVLLTRHAFQETSSFLKAA